MLKHKVWMVGFLMMASGVIQAQEPALNVQPPAAAPILESATTPATAVEAPVVTNAPVAIEAPVVVPVAPVVPVVPVATLVPDEVEVTETPAQVWQNTSWQVGTRYMEFQLQDKQRGTPGNGSFFGTISDITEKQDSVPNKVYVQYRLFKSPVWIGVSYDHVTAQTMDDSNGDGVPDSGGGDGSEEIQGVIPYVHAAWENPTRFTPYVQAGIGFYEAKFVPNSAWGNNGQRYVEASSNIRGLELAGGLTVRLYKNLSADIFAKTMQIDEISGDWYFNYGRNYGGPYVMTMSYVAYGAGLNLRF
jgi:hypothetical protein